MTKFPSSCAPFFIGLNFCFTTPFILGWTWVIIAEYLHLFSRLQGIHEFYGHPCTWQCKPVKSWLLTCHNLSNLVMQNGLDFFCFSLHLFTSLIHHSLCPFLCKLCVIFPIKFRVSLMLTKLVVNPWNFYHRLLHLSSHLLYNIEEIAFFL